MLTLEKDRLIELALESGYTWFQRPSFDLLFGAVRTEPSVMFDDTMFCLCYVPNAGVTLFQWKCTTTHGPKGTAEIPLGFHKGLWTAGLHHGKDWCLVQAAPVKAHVERDPGFFAIQVHYGGERGQKVGNWSEGCQAVPGRDNMKQIRWLYERQLSHWKYQKLSYWLMSEAQYRG